MALRILVTGASGLIGRAVTRSLLEQGHHVTTLQRGSPPAGLKAVEVLRADINGASARGAAARADVVVHLAGKGDVQESWASPEEYFRVVVGGTLNVLEGARTGGARVLIASTQRVYWPLARPLRETDRTVPMDPYAQAKLAAEGLCRLYAERYGIATVALRLFSVYGPGQQGQGNSGVVAIFAERAREGLPLVVAPGPSRDFTQVDDVAEGISLAIARGRRGFSLYNLATGVGTTLRELAELVVETLGSSAGVEAPDGPWNEGNLIADVRRARRELGFEPRISLREGLERTLLDAERPA